ncbi:hypothetical protein WJX72_002306 [[Myrmecia] bisecta]|uniref:Calponin-homology (CH) domain-containing protein n=1 Tax=[Myrmecia] bisecta TaxID=41462 RepID=A0AAW1Q0H1_9CHLO
MAQPQRPLWERDLNVADSSQQTPVLHLEKFSEPPWLDFGRMKTGSHKTVVLEVKNKSLLTQDIALERVPNQQGFHVLVEGKSAPVGTVWTVAPAGRLTIETPHADAADAARAARPRQSFSYFHTGLWMDKQERAFTAWLNSVLVPGRNDEAADALAARRLAARMRGVLWRLYSQDAEIISVMVKVESRIDAGFLRMRDEEAQLGDLKLRESAMDVLKSYHPFWLRLAVEIVVGQVITPPGGLHAFMLERFLNDPELARQHAFNAGIDGLYPPEYWVELGRVVLKRFLLLVLLLDRAVLGPRLPPAVPLLFQRKALIKSSAAVASTFLRGRLFGEGDVMRHLSGLGFRLQYQQDPLAEFDFGISNLALDLRDGLRLCKLVETLTGMEGVLAQVRFPAKRRPSQLFNLALALEAMQEAGLPLDGIKVQRGVVTLRAEDISGGDREATLGLLWRLITQFQLPLLVEAAKLKAEIQRVLKRNERRRSLARSCAAPAPVLDVYMANERMSLLMQWAGAVCAGSGVPVHNFTVAFADGRVLCLLVNYYLPWCLSKDAIYVAESASAEDAAVFEAEEEIHFSPKGWCAVFEAGGCIDQEAIERHRDGVRRNFALVQDAAKALGDIPLMLSSNDFAEHGPDEKAVITYMAFLCSRLLEAILRGDLSRRAFMDQVIIANILQVGLDRKYELEGFRWGGVSEHIVTRLQAMRRASVQRRAFLRQRQQAILVQSLARRFPQRMAFLQLKGAALLLQAHWRGWAVRWLLRRTKRVWRGHRARAHVQRIKAALLIQRLVRGHQVRRRLARRCSAASLIQANWRAAYQRQVYLRLRHSAVIIQASMRSYAQRMRFLELRGAALTLQHAAATCIQSHWRTAAQLAAYRHHCRCVIRIQAAARGMLARLLLKRIKAAVVIQRVLRGRNTRVRLARQVAAAVAIQSGWRGSAQRRQYQRQRRCLVALQACVRRHAARKQFLSVRAAAIAFQAGWRARQARLLLQRIRAVVVLQKVFRGQQARQWAARKAFLALRAAAVVMQASWRARQARLLLRRMKAAVVLQKTARGHAVRRQLRRQQAAAVVLQAQWRAVAQRQRFRVCRGSATAVQAAFRGWAGRMQFLQLRGAAILTQQRRFHSARMAVIKVQAVARMRVQRMAFVQQRTAAIAFQTAWRARQARILLRQTRAAVVIQRYASMLEMRAAMQEFARAARQYSLRCAAVIKLQALARGFAARRQYRIILAAHQARLQAAAEVRAAALAFIAPWATMFRDRCHFRRIRRATRVIQRQWRAALQVRTCAACTIQAAVRGFLARTQWQRAQRAAVALQAWWRGVFVRAHDGKRKREMRRRLAAAATAALQAPHRQLGARTMAAREVLLTSKQLSHVMIACETLDNCTRYSKGCCQMVADDGGITALLHFIRSCNRSKPQADLLKRALGILVNVCRYPTLVPVVFRAEECVNVLGEQLQINRDKEDVFVASVSVLQRLVADPGRATAVKQTVATVRHLDSIAQILARKIDMEHKYLSRLEGQKGSDVSAREATRKMVAATRQLRALQQVLTALGVTNSEAQAVLATIDDLKSSGASCATPMWAARNTIVRDALNEISNRRGKGGPHDGSHKSGKAVHPNAAKHDQRLHN